MNEITFNYCMQNSRSYGKGILRSKNISIRKKKLEQIPLYYTISKCLVNILHTQTRLLCRINIPFLKFILFAPNFYPEYTDTRVIEEYVIFINLIYIQSQELVGRQKPFLPTRNWFWCNVTDQWSERKIEMSLLSISIESWTTRYPFGLNMRSISTATSTMSHLTKKNVHYQNHIS